MPHAALAQFLQPAPPEASAGLSSIDAILDAVRAHLGMDIAFASRFTETERQFTHIRCDFPLPLAPGDAEPREDSFCQRILDGRLPELIHDASEFASARELPITAALPIGSHMNVPLTLADGSLYGTFCCISRIPDRSLTGRDMDTLRAFAHLAAAQIDRDLDDQRGRDDATRRVRDAIARGLPQIHLQPIHRLLDGAPVGVEALARFPDNESRPPNEWFAEAAAYGMGVELELAAIRAALVALPFVPAPHYVALNVSPETVLSDALEPLLAAAPPRRIVLEVTEHAQVEDYQALRNRLARLQRLARIAIDDVGAGYSSMRHILDLRPDILKLDISLTRDVDRDPARQSLITALVSFAAGIGCTLVAEGIERAGEQAMLRDLGVANGQGWFFSRAMPPVAVQQLLLGAGSAPDEERAPKVVMPATPLVAFR